MLVQRIPAGAFRCKTNVPVQYIDMLVLRKMDKVAYALAEELENAGHPSFVTAAQETDWHYKRASYGPPVDERHLGVEAGLGTLGLEVNILTPEFGPRVYLTGILTEVELTPDRPITEQVCIGESCSRCLTPARRTRCWHFGIDKRACATEAQEFGFSTILQFFERSSMRRRARRPRWPPRAKCSGSGRGCCASSARSAIARAASRSAGRNDTRASVRRAEAIPERTPAKVALARLTRGEPRPRVRRSRAWTTEQPLVGPEGYKGMVARQLQDFKEGAKPQADERAAPEPAKRALTWCRSSRNADRPTPSRRRRARSAPISSQLRTAQRWRRIRPTPKPAAALRHHRTRRQRVIVLAKRLNRERRAHRGLDDRHKYYNDELALTRIEEASLDSSLARGQRLSGDHRAADPRQSMDLRGRKPEKHLSTLLSLPHAAVEAGLGTLASTCTLTPNTGPRSCSPPCSAGRRRMRYPHRQALCSARPVRAVSRCVPATRSDIGSRDWSACDPHRSPHALPSSPSTSRASIAEPDANAQEGTRPTPRTASICGKHLARPASSPVAGKCADVCPVGGGLPIDAERRPRRPSGCDAREGSPRRAHGCGRTIRRIARDLRRPERWIGNLPAGLRMAPALPTSRAQIGAIQSARKRRAVAQAKRSTFLCGQTRPHRPRSPR